MGLVYLHWYWYAGAACSGTQTSLPNSAYVTDADEWQFLSTGMNTAPAGTQSAWVVLGVYKTDPDPGTFQGNFDKLNFRETLFADGFEDGTTGAWSGTVGEN